MTVVSTLCFLLPILLAFAPLLCGRYPVNASSHGPLFAPRAGSERARAGTGPASPSASPPLAAAA